MIKGEVTYSISDKKWTLTKEMNATGSFYTEEGKLEKKEYKISESDKEHLYYICNKFLSARDFPDTYTYATG